MGVLQSAGNSLGGLLNLSVSTVEWGKSFINKYAAWLLAILFVLIFGKAFRASIKA
jgi:hypothetical protein